MHPFCPSLSKHTVPVSAQRFLLSLTPLFCDFLKYKPSWSKCLPEIRLKSILNEVRVLCLNPSKSLVFSDWFFLGCSHLTMEGAWRDKVDWAKGKWILCLLTLCASSLLDLSHPILASCATVHSCCLSYHTWLAGSPLFTIIVCVCKIILAK